LIVTSKLPYDLAASFVNRQQCIAI